MQHSSMPSRETGERRPALAAGRLVLPILLFVLAGVPLVAYLWETANRIFAGKFELIRVVFAAIALVGLIVLLRIIARTVTRWEETRFD